MKGRSRTIVSQAMIGIGLKAGSVAATFAAMPLALHALGSQQMGVWLVLLSVYQWITLFDLGIGPGARNEIARAAATGSAEWVQRAVATGWYYAMLASGALLVSLGLLLLVTPLGDWLSIWLFNGAAIASSLGIVLVGACIAFTLNFVLTVYSALERPAAQSAYAFLSNVGFAGLLAASTWIGLRELAEVALLYALAMLLSAGAILIDFRHRHPSLWPRRAAIDHALREPILHGGLRVFSIQLCAMAIFTTDRILVSAFVSPAAVVSYDAAFRLFSLITMTHTLVMGSAWSSFTQAHAKGEWNWIRATMRRLSLSTLAVAALALAMAWFAAPVISAWLGPAQVGPPLLYACFALSTVLACWSNVFAYFLTALGDTRAQIRSAIAATVINFPASYFFAVMMKMEAAGVVLGTCCAMLVFSFIGPVVSRKRLAEQLPIAAASS